jgi:hypothetical protein
MAFLAVLAFAGMASACTTCHQTPCVVAPAYQCVITMVPYTVYKPHVRIEFETVTETIMVKVADTTYVERQRCVNKPVWDTHYVQREVSFCKPVHETTMVTQQYTIYKPVSTTHQVTEYCMKPTSTLVSVPVYEKKCGHVVACGCQTVEQITYTPVPVVKDVVTTQLVPECVTKQIPVTTTHFVPETKIETVPIRTCRLVPEIVTDRIPVVSFHCEPKVVTRQIPHKVCETIAVTCYQPVKTMVPVVCAPAPAPVAAPAPSTQAAPTTQS